MPDQLAVDLSTARPAGSAIAAAGYTAVIGYLSGGLLLDGRPKDLDALYIADLQAAGLGVGLIWETSADRALGGAPAGAVDGALAVDEARSIGYPPGCPLLANLGDFPATSSQIAAIHAYYYAFRRVPGFSFQPGGYATRYIIDQLAAAGAVGCWWQNAENDAGDPGDIVSPNAAIYQRTAHTRPLIAGCAPGDYDEDVWNLPAAPATVASLYRPAWYKAAPTPGPAPAPAPAVESVTITVDLDDGTTTTLRAYP